MKSLDLHVGFSRYREWVVGISPATHKEEIVPMNRHIIKPIVIALTAVAVTVVASAASAATRVAGTCCCPLCR